MPNLIMRSSAGMNAVPAKSPFGTFPPENRVVLIKDLPFMLLQWQSEPAHLYKTSVLAREAGFMRRMRVGTEISDYGRSFLMAEKERGCVESAVGSCCMNGGVDHML